MKYLVVLAFCMASGIANATAQLSEPEEVMVIARRIEICLQAIKGNHKQDPKTGDWYYVAEQVDPDKIDTRFVIVKKEERS